MADQIAETAYKNDLWAWRARNTVWSPLKTEAYVRTSAKDVAAKRKLSGFASNH